MNIQRSVLCALGLGLLANPSGAGAATDEWQFEVTPYLFASGMDGTVGVRGYKSDVDMSFSDIWDTLDMAFLGVFTAQKGPWSFALDGMYFKLKDEGSKTVTGPGGVVSINGELDLTAKMYLVQGSVGYRVLDDATKVDVLGAVRYIEIDLDADVEIAFTPPIFSGSAGGKGSESWADVVVGARVLHPLSEKVSLLGYADIGGGGSDLTYQLLGGVNWTFSENLTAKLGYRYLSWDYEDGGNKWDMAISGPYIGLGIRF